MYKAHKCKHCGMLEGDHAALRLLCLKDGKVVNQTQMFEADPEKFTVYPNASRPRTPSEMMLDIGRNR